MKVVSKEEMLSSVGQQLETTDWLTVTQDQINQFADCTLDHQFIHVDPEKARESPFGTTIAHGFLSLSLLSHFYESFSLIIEGFYMGVNYGFNKVRFIAPVPVNSRIRCHSKVAAVVEKNPGQFMITTEVELEIEGGEKPALKAEWIAMQMVK